MEASLPFTTFECKEDLTTTIEVAIPFRILLIFEVLPHIVMDLLEPIKALLVSSKLICLDEADC